MSAVDVAEVVLMRNVLSKECFQGQLSGIYVCRNEEWQQ